MTDTSIWPVRPTCHDTDPHAQRYAQMSDGHAAVWRGPVDRDARADPGRESYRPFRSCSYCGSIHPEDLFTALNAGAVLHGSDWKYGWPHKFYVDGIPHAHPEREIWRGGRSAPKYQCRTCGFEPPLADTVTLCAHVTDRLQYAIIGTHHEDHFAPVGPTLHAKWYNIHLTDLSAATFEVLAPLLYTHSDIQFHRAGDRLGYRAPCAGYQR